MTFNAVPNTGQTLGGTRDQIRTNINLLKNSLAVNHVDLGLSNVGKHKFVEMPVGSLPAGLIAGEGTLYTKNATTFPAVTEASLFYTPDNSNNEYQLTRTVSGVFAYFGMNVNNYNAGGTGAPVGGDFTAGWTFLPGQTGLMFAYGTVSLQPSGSIAVSYPITFVNPPFNIQLTLQRPAASPGSSFSGFWVDNGSITTTGFNIINNTTHSFGFYWTAIGS